MTVEGTCMNCSHYTEIHTPSLGGCVDSSICSGWGEPVEISNGVFMGCPKHKNKG